MKVFVCQTTKEKHGQKMTDLSDQLMIYHCCTGCTYLVPHHCKSRVIGKQVLAEVDSNFLLQDWRRSSVIFHEITTGKVSKNKVEERSCGWYTVY